MQPKYNIQDQSYIAEPVRVGDSMTLELAGHLADVRIQRHDQHYATLNFNGAEHEFYAAQDGDKLFIHFAGKTWPVHIENEFSNQNGSDRAGSGAICSPMPGVMLETRIEVGDQVQLNQSLVLIESMKLQTEILAPCAGTVVAVNYVAGQSFEKNSILVEIDGKGESA